MLDRFNHYMNLEFMSAAYGTALSMEELESMSLRAMLYALTGSEEPNPLSKIEVSDIINLIEELDHQGKYTVQRVSNEV